MKVSLVTPCFNAASTVADTVRSVLSQKGVDLEYIVMDGGSTDGTVERVRELLGDRGVIVSEPDAGLYDAINRGFARATGDIVGILNADDVFEDDSVLAHVAAAFDAETDAVYADIRFVRELGGRTVRYCSARRFSPWMFRFGVMVPHPSFYCRRALFARFGGYSLDYRIAADFELTLRFLGRHRIRAKYLDRCLVTMRTGGLSTAGLASNLAINREDLRALRANGYRSALPLLYLKYLFKVWGVVFARLHR